MRHAPLALAVLAALALAAGAVSRADDGDSPDVAKTAAELPALRAAASSRSVADGTDRVAPGRVSWHADRAAAERASRVSGKPVMVFQLLGNLDEEFC